MYSIVTVYRQVFRSFFSSVANYLFILENGDIGCSGIDHQQGHNNKKELFHRVKTFNVTATCRW